MCKPCSAECIPQDDKGLKKKDKKEIKNLDITDPPKEFPEVASIGDADNKSTHLLLPTDNIEGNRSDVVGGNGSDAKETNKHKKRSNL